MKPVMQSRLHDPDGLPGNCFAACLASLLECNLDEVPWPRRGDFDTWVHYWPCIDRFLASRGLGLLSVPCRKTKPRALHVPKGELFAIPKGGIWMTDTFGVGVLHMASGPGPRGPDHCVIREGGNIVHDPHPDGGGLLRISSINFLLPMDPAALPHGRHR